MKKGIYLEILPLSFSAVHSIPGIVNQRRIKLEMLPMSFNAVHSIPGIENEKDIPRNASLCHSMQFSQLQV